MMDITAEVALKQMLECKEEWEVYHNDNSWSADDREFYEAVIYSINAITRVQQLEAMEWVPIDTAPKNGHILLWHGEVFKHPFIGWYNHSDGKFELVDFFRNKKEPYAIPTHWMPLPPPPK